MASLKGVGVNNLSTPLAPYQLDWYHTSWGPWCWNWQGFPNGERWVFYLYEKVPATSDLLTALANPHHGLWWGIGDNEVDIKRHPQHFTPEDVQNEANRITQQATAVLSVQPTAKFALGASSQEHSPNNPYGSPCWHDALWPLLPEFVTERIKALRIHWYPQVEFWIPGDGRTFHKAPIKREINRYEDWLEINNVDAQIWLDEIGLKWNGVNVVPTNPTVYTYPSVVQLACNEAGADRWSWFGFDHEAEGYVTVDQLGPNFASV